MMKNKRNYNGLHFVETGEGEIALVFLHYFGGSSKTWRALIAELSGEYNCIAVDLPGFGDSALLKEGVTMSDNATAVLELIQFLNLTRFVLIGHSMGGKIALSVASFKPAGLEAMILIAPSPATPEPMNDKERKQLQEAYGDKIALRNNINKILAKPLPDEIVEGLIEDNLKVSQNAWNAWTEAGSREDISDNLLDIDIPVFVFSGDADAKLSSSFLHTEFVKYFPKANFAEVVTAGHLIPVEKPQIVANLILKALALGGKRICTS